MRMRKEHEIDRREVPEFETGTLDPLQQEKPVRKIRIDQHIQVVELHQKRSMANPGDGHLAGAQFGEDRFVVLSGTRREQGFPDHFAKKRARIECPGGVKSLNDRGILRWIGGGRLGSSFVIRT